MVDVTPGNLGANKGHWAKQLRDRFSRFMEEGSFVLIEIELPGVYGKVHATGKVVRAVSPGVVLVRVETNKEIPAGDYEVSTENITVVQATIPLEHLEKKAAETRGETAPAEVPLKKSMAGSEVLKERLRSVARALKADGRFPIPRITPTSTIGKTSDTAKGAKLDYKKVFDAEPALQEKYKTPENMWEAVYNYGVDERTKSPNELVDIPEDMKELNRAYAKHVLGLDPEGLITFYRNAINSKFTEEESAVGYVSIDRDMAYDYNARFEQRNANGRYEIDVKPAEVFGMLGYSKVEDEYGVTIGREVTAIPDRVRRIGDLASPEIQAPWLKELADKYRIAYGASPFRGFNMLSEFDFHPVEPLGQTSEEFFQKYNVSAADLKAKFDQLFGEGAYDRYKASGNTVNFQRIRDLFVKLPDGRIGLDGAKLEDMGRLVKPEEMVNDLLDNTLKMLSVFQELTGQPFMTHKTRDYAPPVQEKEEAEKPAETTSSPVIPPGPENWIPVLTDILKLTADSESEDNNFDPELGNKRLSIVMEKAGYNAKPTLVSPEEFGSIEGQTLYRGIVDQRFIDQYKNSSKHFAGQGNFGNGTYSTSSRETAARYGGSDNNVMEIKMASNANIKRFDSRKEYLDWVEETLDKFREEYGNSGVSDEEYYDFAGQMNNVVDWTNVAVMLGIDAVEFPHSSALEERYTIILNRGKVIVNDRP